MTAPGRYDEKHDTSLLAQLPIRIPPRTRAFVMAIALWALGIGIGIYVTARGSRSTGELKLDETIASDRGSILVDVSKVIDVVFGQAVGPVLLLVLCLIAWRTIGLRVALWAGGLTLLGWFSVAVFKMIFHRHRPPTATVHALVVETQPDSFPSGHTAFTTALVVGFLVALCGHHELRRIVLLIGIPLVVVVAASRLVLGAHFLGDVTAAPLLATGTILGAASLTRTGGRWGRPVE